jgi:hypothetical protein
VKRDTPKSAASAREEGSRDELLLKLPEQVHRESADKVVDAVVRPLRDPAGPFQKPLSNGDAVSHEDLALDVRRSAFGVFFRS